MPTSDRSELKDWSRERKIVLKREEGNGCRTRGRRSSNVGTSLPRERRKRGRREKLLRWSEDVRRTRRIGQSSRRLKRRSGRRRPRSSAGCRSSVRRSERRPEGIEEAEIVPSLAAGAAHVETMVQDVETMDQDVEMTDPGEEMTDPGEMGLSDQGLVAPPGSLAAEDGETGSKRRMRSGDPGAAPEEALLRDAMIATCAVDLHQDVDLLQDEALLLVRIEMPGPGGVAEVLPPGEMTGEAEEAVTKDQLEAVPLLETATGICGVEDHLAVIAMAGMAVAAPGEEEAAIVTVEIVTCVAEDPGMMIVVDPLRDVTLPVTMDLETGAVDLPVMIVTNAVDPLVMMDLAHPHRNQQENKMMAGPLSRPSVNSQLSSRLSVRAR